VRRGAGPEDLAADVDERAREAERAQARRRCGPRRSPARRRQLEREGRVVLAQVPAARSTCTRCQPTWARSASSSAAVGAGASGLAAAGPKPHARTSGPTVTSSAPSLARLISLAVCTTSSSPREAGNGSVLACALKRVISESGAPGRHLAVDLGQLAAISSSMRCCVGGASGATTVTL
jgi:hypothetical protein